MKLRGGIAAALLTIGVAAVPPAHAASTHAEYIAQVDPICQTFVRPENKAAKAYYKNYKEWVRRLSKGTLKGWVRQTKRTGRSLRRFIQIDANLTDQIAAVPAPAEDAETVGTWLDYRNKAERYAYSAANAFLAFKFERFYKQLARANKATARGIRTISGFGFQVCGVKV